MTDHITVGRQNLHRKMVPCIPAGPSKSAPTYIVHQSQQVAQASPVKKKFPEEWWYLQAYSMYRLSDVQGPEELPEIWQTLATLTK